MMVCFAVGTDRLGERDREVGAVYRVGRGVSRVERVSGTFRGRQRD